MVLQWRLSPDTPLLEPTADGSTDLGGGLKHLASVRRTEAVKATVDAVLEKMKRAPPGNAQIFVKTLTVRRTCSVGCLHPPQQCFAATWSAVWSEH